MSASSTVGDKTTRNWAPCCSALAFNVSIACRMIGIRERRKLRTQGRFVICFSGVCPVYKFPHEVISQIDPALHQIDRVRVPSPADGEFRQHQDIYIGMKLQHIVHGLLQRGGQARSRFVAIGAYCRRPEACEETQARKRPP